MDREVISLAYKFVDLLREKCDGVREAKSFRTYWFVSKEKRFLVKITVGNGYKIVLNSNGSLEIYDIHNNILYRVFVQRELWDWERDVLVKLIEFVITRDDLKIETLIKECLGEKLDSYGLKRLLSALQFSRFKDSGLKKFLIEIIKLNNI